MTDSESELRPAYRTLAEPMMLLGLAWTSWLALLAAGGASYGLLILSPLPWRLSFSIVVICLGSPTALLLLREASAVSPGRLLLAAIRWRTRSSQITAQGAQPVRRDGVRLDRRPPAVETTPPEAEVLRPMEESA